MSLESRLEQFDQSFNEAEATTNATTDLPAGTYTCRVEDPEIFESKQGRLFLKFKLKVTEGELKGQAASKLYSLDNPERFRFLKGDLIAMGLCIQKMSDLPKNIGKIDGITVTVNVVHKDKYVNYYINGIAKSAPTATGDVPF